MIEGKRQKQVAAVLEKELNDIFKRLGLTMIDGGMVSIASVKITPDLFDARIYLSFFKVKDAIATLKFIQEKSWEIKKELTEKGEVDGEPWFSMLRHEFHHLSNHRLKRHHKHCKK